MSNNRKYSYEDDAAGEIISWVIVFVCIIAVWPLGLYLLWRKSKKSERRRAQRDRHRAEASFNNTSKTHTHAQSRENHESRQKSESVHSDEDDPISEVARDIEDVVREVTTEAASVVKTIREELGDVFSLFRDEDAERNRRKRRRQEEERQEAEWQNQQQRHQPQNDAAQNDAAQNGAAQSGTAQSGASKNSAAQSRRPAHVDFSQRPSSDFDEWERPLKEIGATSVKVISLCLLVIAVFFFIFALRVLISGIGMIRGPGDIYSVFFFLLGAVATLIAGFVISGKTTRSGRSPRASKKARQSKRDKRNAEQAQAALQQQQSQAYDGKIHGGQTLQEMKTQFMSITSELRELNRSIADFQISQKADKIESLTSKIFRTVEEKPEKRPRIDRFLSYYLPTTTKLLKAYSNFEKQGVKGENITKAKEKIARTLDTLTAGFELQLDQLFESDVMDIAAEVKVLENLMKQDGLSGEKGDFDN